MRNYLIAFFAIATIASAAAIAGQEEYEKCMKKCMKLLETDEERQKCPKVCEFFLEDE
jgi:hypothetical protein